MRDNLLDDAGLRELGKLTGLLRLNLGDSRIDDSGLQHLSGMKDLQYLAISKTAVSKLDALPPLAKLEYLDLEDTHMESFRLENPDKFPALNVINVFNTFDARLDPVKQLADLSKIKSLQVVLASSYDPPVMEELRKQIPNKEFRDARDEKNLWGNMSARRPPTRR